MLSKVRYEDWRFGRVLYLEQVCEGGLGKLAAVLREMRSYADSQNLKPSWCCYKRWDVQKKTGQGKRPAVRLRFSKSGDPAIEEKYATHYVDRERIAALKAAEDSRIVPDL